MKRIYKFIGIDKIKKPFYLFSTLLILLAGGLGIFYSIKTYPIVFSNRVTVEKNAEINPRENIVINFSEPIFLTKAIQNIEIYPVQNVKFIWEDSNRKLVIEPQESWKLETEYEIEIPRLKNIMLISVPEKEIRFATIKYPKITQFFPEENAENIVVDIEDPLAVKFNEPVEDFDVKLLVDSLEAASCKDEEKNNYFSFLPKNIEDGKKYFAQVLIKHKDESEDNFKPIYSSSFKTTAPEKKSGKDFETILKEAKINTGAKIKEGKYIDLNLANQVLSTFENGKLLDSYMVSTGKRGMETPKGEFKVMAKKIRPWSNKYKLYMPFFMQFTGQGHGIHELPEWPGGYKEGANHLGTPVSHGCVRLGVGPAEQVYNWAETGTPVVIY